jgi:hypothetical protein
VGPLGSSPSPSFRVDGINSCCQARLYFQEGIFSVVLQSAEQQQPAACHSEAGFIGEEIRFLPAAKQQIPRVTIPRFGMTTLWGFSNGNNTRVLTSLPSTAEAQNFWASPEKNEVTCRTT